MRTIAPLCVLATLCTLAALPAQAQKVERIKASGANAAGVCAGSLEMVGQYLSRAQNPDPQKFSEVQQARDFFADLRMYPAADVAAAANAFISFMNDRIGKAATEAERQAIQREIVEISSKCTASAKATVTASRNAAGTPPPAAAGTVAAGTVAAGTVQPYVAPPASTVQPYVQQPATIQPYVVQPSTAQPYSTEPLLLDPVAPAR